MTRGARLFLFAVMAFGQFMALVDIQIVAASLNAVQAGLSAAPDEISWVQTAYLMAELVMIPLAGFLARALSTRWLFAASAGLFTLASALCGLAWDIDAMIAFRVFQGFVGGAMVPTVWATGYLLFSGRDRALASSILGVVTMLAPVTGPTIGGWITELIGWRWIFYINIVPGIAVTVLSAMLIRFDTAQPSLLRTLDWSHLLAMALFLSCLDYVLEEGPRHDWFHDTGIAVAAWVALVAFLLFVERSLHSATPVVRLTPFRRPTFVLASTLALATSAAIFAATYLVPVFLGRVRGFNSLDIGTTVCVTGLGMLVSAPLTMRLLKHCDPRLVMLIGVLLFTASLWLFSFIGPDWGFRELFWPHVLRGVAGMLCVVPAANLALADLADEALHEASGLFNLLRNLGGALGIALVNTWLQDHGRLHLLRLGEALGARGDQARQALDGVRLALAAHTTDAAQALLAAQALFERQLQRQALVLAFDDVFRQMAWLLLATVLLLPWCRPAPPSSTPHAIES
ncbi:MFS transporter [Duganella sp. Leaf126]|uniref:DHA2 family efflux MFS transporter permease subunit n=1 Tax=Duganella sp. Leaf126 TaxID=1736266 RepID=UPI0006F93C23|nr:DHA2 family efflux MFS transporter permease subunit [Duganella sp. Leaf126]KQQ40271.1 MFS transporter [Duganella sp. Leaf126]